MKAIGLTLTALTLGALSAGAGIISYDGFDYPVATGVPASNGGIGWAAGWQANGTDVGEMLAGSISSGDATFDASSTGNRLSWTNGANGDGWSRQLAASRSGTDTTFFSFMLEYDRTTATESFYFGLDTQIRNPRSWAATRFRLNRNGVDTSQTLIEQYNGSAWVQVGSTLNVDTTNPTLVVFSVDAQNDTLNLWLNPTPSSTAPSADVSGAIAAGSFNWVNFAGEWNNWKLDEVRLGDSFGDVTAVPEPATYAALLGALALGGVLWRRPRG
jgi:hypothetical protein